MPEGPGAGIGDCGVGDQTLADAGRERLEALATRGADSEVGMPRSRAEVMA